MRPQTPIPANPSDASQRSSRLSSLDRFAPSRCHSSSSSNTNGIWRVVWVVFGEVLGRFWLWRWLGGSLGSLWGGFGEVLALGKLWGCSGETLGKLWGGSVEALGRLWEALGRLWEAFGRIWEALGRLWGGFGDISGGSGSVLG